MKKIFNTTLLPCLMAILGAGAAGARYLMYTTAVDDKGLLVTGNLPGIAVAALTVLAAALVIAAARLLPGTQRYSANFPASIPGALGAGLLAAGIAWTLGFDPRGLDTLGALRFWAGWLSLPCLLLTAYGRWRGVRPIFLLHGAVCLFYGLNLADHYRIWSAEPQLSAYFFELLACVGLMLTAYQRTAFDVGMGRRKAYQVTGLMTGFLCFAAITASPEPVFYLAGGLWCLAGLLGGKAEP